MAIFRLTTGNERVRLNRREEDTVVVESGSRRDRDIVLRFESEDKIDLSAFGGIDAQELIDNAIPCGRHNVILTGEFGRLALIVIPKARLSPEMLITDDRVDVNQPPVAVDDFASTQENTPKNILVLDNDIDPDGDTLSINDFDSTSENGGAIVLNRNGSFSNPSDDFLVYTPAASFAGTDSFSYAISDAAGATASAVVSINVQPGGGTGNLNQIIGNNLLTSETGMRETLEGGAGNDIIIGNRGSDILLGGAGADVFVYNSLADSGADPDARIEGGDNILDFNPAEDIIRFNFEVAPGRPVSIDDVQINTEFISFGLAIIGVSTPSTPPDFLPEQFVISLNNLDPTTTEADIRSRIQFG